MKYFAIVFLMVSTACEAAEQQASANPIRKVSNMLKALKAKVVSEGEHEKELYDKFMCYCKTNGNTLTESIAVSQAKVPQLEADIKAAEEKKAQLAEELKEAIADRGAARTSMQEAKGIREKEAVAFASLKADQDSNVEAIAQAVAALEKGMVGSFIQSSASARVQKLAVDTVALSEGDRQRLLAFLSGAQGTGYAPASGQVVGILKQISDTMAAGLAEATAAEEAAIKSFSELTEAKLKEVASLSEAIETKTARVGELGVDAERMKGDLAQTQDSLQEDQQFLQDLQGDCDTKTSEWGEILQRRAAEVVAISETITILTSDDALELFKKVLPASAASFVQVQVSAASLRARALALVNRAQHRGTRMNTQLDLIALALQSKTGGFEKVITMIDEMMALLKKEQQDDDSKKAYCHAEFDQADDKVKGIERSIADLEVAIVDTQQGIKQTAEEIADLKDSINALDKRVAEATEQRKADHADFVELMTTNAAAKKLINLAKNRLQFFYNPGLHEKALVQISVHDQGSVAPPPPPDSFKAYAKKHEENAGVLAMMDLLIKDVDKEMTVAQTDEKHAQTGYEKLMSDAAAQRATDSDALASKAAAKADMEAELHGHKAGLGSAKAELKATLAYLESLHGECDWLLAHWDVRLEARNGEIASLNDAKAVLSGADFSAPSEESSEPVAFVQTGAASGKRLRGILAWADARTRL